MSFIISFNCGDGNLQRHLLTSGRFTPSVVFSSESESHATGKYWKLRTTAFHRKLDSPSFAHPSVPVSYVLQSYFSLKSLYIFNVIYSVLKISNLLYGVCMDYMDSASRGLIFRLSDRSFLLDFFLHLFLYCIQEKKRSIEQHRCKYMMTSL